MLSVAGPPSPFPMAGPNTTDIRHDDAWSLPPYLPPNLHPDKNKDHLWLQLDDVGGCYARNPPARPRICDRGKGILLCGTGKFSPRDTALYLLPQLLRPPLNRRRDFPIDIPNQLPEETVFETAICTRGLQLAHALAPPCFMSFSTPKRLPVDNGRCCHRLGSDVYSQVGLVTPALSNLSIGSAAVAQGTAPQVARRGRGTPPLTISATGPTPKLQLHCEFKARRSDNAPCTADCDSKEGDFGVIRPCMAELEVGN